MDKAPESSFFSKLGLFALGAFALCIFLGKFALYGANGLPKPSVNKAVYDVHIVGESVGADYAALQLLYGGQGAYEPENQTVFTQNDMKAQMPYLSSLSPVAAFLLKPFKVLPYANFSAQWLIAGIFAYALAMYALAPLKKSVFFLFVTPSLTLSAVSGGWGLFLTCTVVLTLFLNPEKKRTIGFFAGLTACSFPAFCAVTAVLIVRKQLKSAILGLLFALLLTAGALSAFPVDAFAQSVAASFEACVRAPALYASVFSVLLLNGAPVWAAAAAQTAVIAAVVYFAVRLWRKRTPDSIFGAYVCLVLPLIYWNALPSDYALTMAGCVVLWRELARTMPSDEIKTLLIFALILPFFDALFVQNAGVSVLPVIAGATGCACVQKSLPV